MKATIKDGVVYSPYPKVDIPSCSIYEAMSKFLSRAPEQLAVVDETMKLTRGEFLSRMRRFAAGFQAHGVGLGDCVCVHLENSVDNLVALFSLTFTGASVLLSNPILNEGELLFQVQHSEATHILTTPRNAAKVLAVQKKTNVKKLFVMGEDMPGFASTSTFAEMNEKDFREVPIEDPKNTTVALFYSSGTTGDAKGMEISHQSVVANLHTQASLMQNDPDDVLLAWYPITYASGFIFIPVAACAGSTCVIVHPGLSFDEFVHIVNKYAFLDLDTGKKVGAMQYGEMFFRIPSVMKGYFKNPELTSKFKDAEGWCRSGDVMYYDEDGYVYFVDRLKDMIKCLDQQVSPCELEGILRSHKSVVDVAVVGVPDTKYGDAPAAFVVTKNSKISSAELATELKNLVAGKTEKFKHLYAGVIFIDRLPRNAAGKVLKHQLTRPYKECKVY
ncbi:luciferin 4-monooxygenase-like isoform X3 [Haemaphysalis longicornis]